MNRAIVILQAADLDALLELERVSFAGEDRWSAQSWRAELAESESAAARLRHHVIGWREPGGQLIACAGFSVIAEDAELLRIMTHPQHRRRGLAAMLLNAGLEWATVHQAARMLLEVEADNLPAIGLYESFSFVQLARRSDYYGAGRDALILARELNFEGSGEDG